MKTSLKFMIIGLVAVLAACSGEDRQIYDGDASTNQTLLRIENQSYDMRLEDGESASLEIKVLSSTHASHDRTFNVEYVDDNIEDGAVDYDFDHSVTIPANKYIGSFMVNVENSHLDGHNYNLKLEVTAPDSGDDIVLENNMTTINFKPNE